MKRKFKVRLYKNSDYSGLVKLYKQSDQFKFDKVTDSHKNLARKIKKDVESVIIAEDEKGLIGSVSIIEDGRIALLFRLVAATLDKNDVVLASLVEKAEKILRKRGYKEVHNTAPSGSKIATREREKLGFTKGKNYTWFWKRI